MIKGLRIGATLWHRKTGERWLFNGPAMPGLYWVWHPAHGLRRIGTKHLTRGPHVGASRMVPGDPIRVQLVRSMDISQPTLDATVVRVNDVGIPTSVKVEKQSHRVWGGCELKFGTQCKRSKETKGKVA